ncbi:MAG: hypothetical protein CL534_26340 [Ahrensia sp.]|nr:hypothetical protein [Ahrensia sp.]
MSITWEEQGRGEWIETGQRSSAAWKKVAGQVAALAILAVIGGAAGAGIAVWKLDDGAAAPAVEASAAPEAAQPAARTAAMSEPMAEPKSEQMAEPRDIAAPPAVREAVDAEPASRASLFPESEAVLVADADPGTGREDVAAPAEPALAAVPADLPPNGIDAAETASILSPGEPVAVADTAEEAAKLEAMMADESQPPEPDRMAAASADDPAAAFAPDGKPLTPAQADKYVNLRSGPDNESEILEIIPANAELLAEENCTHWCAVTHDGLQGYVYKTFIRR